MTGGDGEAVMGDDEGTAPSRTTGSINDGGGGGRGGNGGIIREREYECERE
jgi:hypothetical protein